MNRKELKDYKYNQEWIKGCLEYIEEYRSTINKLTTVLSDLPKGSRAVYDNEAEKIAKLQDNVKDLLLYINEEQEKQKWEITSGTRYKTVSDTVSANSSIEYNIKSKPNQLCQHGVKY